jgi:hypothetical protein
LCGDCAQIRFHEIYFGGFVVGFFVGFGFGEGVGEAVGGWGGFLGFDVSAGDSAGGLE